jgi:hypothetical protein
MEPAKFGDLLERERSIVHEPGSSRVGHERLSHRILQIK